MKSSGSWISTIANIGVMAGLVLVAFQINQNSELLRLQMLELESQRIAAHELALIGEEGAIMWQKVIEHPEDLTFAEQRVAEAILWPVYESWRINYLLHREGLLGDEWRSRVIAQAPYFLDHAYGRAWWENLKAISSGADTRPTGSESVPADLLRLIDQQLSQTRNFHRDYHRGIMDRVLAERETE